MRSELLTLVFLGDASQEVLHKIELGVDILFCEKIEKLKMPQAARRKTNRLIP